ncbi:MAG: hypothetical protein KDB22_12985 [Planctomycetales bacterium]|nr:hypothetical protein [Planctomycetales bacterium]
MKHNLALLATIAYTLFCCGSVGAQDIVAWPKLASQLAIAGENAGEIKQALSSAPPAHRASLEFLVEHMPEQDLKTLSAGFLLEDVRLAHEARRASPWEISDENFLNYVLPYANVDETREAWRGELRQHAEKIVDGCRTPGEAAQRLNKELYKLLGVKYSTARRKANQCPSESIEHGLASCTGLTILLIDACRSVNVPARLVGIPSWTTKRGNHTWIEIWNDGDWHFTGAAEYNPAGLDKAWFVGDASRADATSTLHSIYAVSFRKTDTLFPMVWSRSGPRPYAINVTERYTKQPIPSAERLVDVRVQIRSGKDGRRLSAPVQVCLAEETSQQCSFGTSKGETDDTNNMLTFQLNAGLKYKITTPGLAAPHIFIASGETQTVSLSVDESVTDKPKLDKKETAQLVSQLYQLRLEKLRQERGGEWDAKKIVIGELEMKFDYRIFGDEPQGGHSLYISMHGGGGTTARVNDSQWRNQIELYEPAEGIYLAPRAPTNTWNLWHQPHIDQFFNRIIEDAIALEGINPNRVYIMGYSAGGDGVYQLAPRMADQLAAAAMMAGHPNGVSPLGLRNIGFTLHMGGKDSAYNRNAKAAEWKETLAELRSNDPDGYVHEVVIHPEFGHWMQRQDAVAIDWMSKFTRNPLPTRVVWHQTGVPHSQFYWLAATETDRVPNAKMMVNRDGNVFTIQEAEGIKEVIIRLNDDMIDFDSPVIVKFGDRIHAFEDLTRSRALIEQTLNERSDTNAVFSAELHIPVN